MATPTAAQFLACAQAERALADGAGGKPGAIVAAAQAVAAFQAEVNSAQAAFDAARAAGSSTSSPGSASGSRTSTSGGGSPTGVTGASGATGAATTESIAAKVAGDNANVLAAQQNVDAAQLAVNQATLTAPIAGTVGQVGLAVGQGVTKSQGIVIVGPGAATVSVSVPLTSVVTMKVGDRVTVDAPGLPDLAGSVSQIGMLPVSTSSTASSSTPNYTVLVTLPDTPISLATGARVTANIVTATVSDVLTLPASAVPGIESGSARVNVVTNGTAIATTIGVGAVGGGVVQVTSGLKAGDQVAIADLSTPLPTNQTSRGLTGGGFPGGRVTVSRG